MGTIYRELDDGLREFIAAQHIYFVASAPLFGAWARQRLAQRARFAPHPRAAGGWLPRPDGQRNRDGLPCAGERPIDADVLRFSRTPADRPSAGPSADHRAGRRTDWDRLAGQFPDYTGCRSIVLLDVERIADSCGYGVPLYEYAGERTQLVAWADRKGSDGIAEYQSAKEPPEHRRFTRPVAVRQQTAALSIPSSVFQTGLARTLSVANAPAKR